MVEGVPSAEASSWSPVVQFMRLMYASSISNGGRFGLVSRLWPGVKASRHQEAIPAEIKSTAALLLL